MIRYIYYYARSYYLIKMEDNIPPADNNDEVNAIANTNNPFDITATNVHNSKTSSDFMSSLITI